MKRLLGSSLLIGFFASLALTVWLLFRLHEYRNGSIFSLEVGLTSLIAHFTVAAASSFFIQKTSATLSGGILRIAVAALAALLAAFVWVTAYSWARSLASDAIMLQAIPKSLDEARFLTASDYRVATICAYCGVFASFASSSIASLNVRRDAAFFAIAALAAFALVAMTIGLLAF
jgi:hypothetical protein